jgi:hypothetical protein
MGLPLVSDGRSAWEWASDLGRAWPINAPSFVKLATFLYPSFEVATFAPFEGRQQQKYSRDLLGQKAHHLALHEP